MKGVIHTAKIFFTALAALLFITCTKIEKGFLSPYTRYFQTEYTVYKGRTSATDALNPDGSTTPIRVKMIHVYDESDKIVDELFLSTYPVVTWLAAYDPLTDTTVDLIRNKQEIKEIAPVAINETNGAIQANTASLNIPAGLYSFDLEVSNEVETKVFNKIVSLRFEDADPYEAAPGLGATSLSAVRADNESVSVGIASPLPTMTVEKVADEPWVINVKIVDKNGVPFNPLDGEIIKRPAGGLNPNPPFLQNLEYYTRSYEPTSTEMKFPYALVPMPFVSLGNGFHQYYRLHTKAIHLEGYPDDERHLNVRFPLRIWVAGSYNVTIQVHNVTHR